MSRERHNLAEAEAVDSAEGNMCGASMRGTDALPWSKASSRPKGTRRNLGGLIWNYGDRNYGDNAGLHPVSETRGLHPMSETP